MCNRAAHQSNALDFDRSAAAAGCRRHPSRRAAGRVFVRSTPFDMSGLEVRYPMPFFIEKEEVLAKKCETATHSELKGDSKDRSVFRLV